jgi:hypothetical protein
MSLIDRLGPRRSVPDATPGPSPSSDEPTFTTKALRKFVASLTTRESPVLLDLGPVVGGNVTFFGEQLGCKIFVEDIFADVDRHVRQDTLDQLPGFFKTRFSHSDGTVDGILCWDVIDYLGRAAAQELASQLIRVLRPEGALLGFFGMGQQPSEMQYHKYIIMDEVTLKCRVRAAARGRQASLVNRDIIRLFSQLRVSDSFLLQNNLREILFRKPVAAR